MLKSPSGALIPASDDAGEMLRKIKVGTPVFVEVKRIRNYKFLKKAFALFKLAFEAWEPVTPLEYKGLPVAKDFERFRKDMTILAGFYKPVYNVRGELRLEAESLSFSSMDDERFETVFRAVLTVVWNRVLKAAGYASEEEVERVVNELMRFDQ
ncbi:DUF1367 family protein (plasmid) [Ideonella dechloratans]|nr:DUF1367 family protein [Ideonella dechloratans]UFU12178.1 DUF1367 family protein [Ideonella dechloratans]